MTYMYILPIAVTSLVNTLMITSVDTCLLRISVICTVVFSLAIYVAFSNVTVATTECNYTYMQLNQQIGRMSLIHYAFTPHILFLGL